MLDFSSVEGTWVNCFGTVTPWQTPLSAEELYFDNTASWYSMNGSPVAVANYLGHPTDGSGAWGNPYNYGYNVEVGVDGTAIAANEADVMVEKRFALGRFSHENAVVMPDQRTVLQSDDGSNVVFFKFVADAAADLSSGTLYAAKMTQAASTSTIAEAAFAIEWVELGSGSDSDIATWIAEYDGTYAEAKHITDQEINDWAEAKSNTDIDGSGSVATSPFADERVAFLETRKAAKALGATAEFNKMEGVNINFDLASTWWNEGAADGTQTYAYMAMSTIGSGMTDTSGDIQIEDDNASCGAVYRMKLVENNGLVDVAAMVPAIVGGPYFGSRAVNECDVNNISNPDNLVIMNDGRVLIGEDTGNHENNMIWLFNDPAI
jgi:secreted PhoX family phosphatase